MRVIRVLRPVVLVAFLIALGLATAHSILVHLSGVVPFDW